MNTKVIQRLDNIIEFFLCAFVFTLPFSKAMVEIFAHGVIGFWIIKKIISGPARREFKEFAKPYAIGIGIPLLAFLLLNFLSTVFSISFPLSAEGFVGKLLPSVLLFVIVAETINTRDKLQRLAVVFLSSMFLLSVDAMFQRVFNFDFFRFRDMEPYLYVRAAFKNPNNFAGWLTFMIPLALSLWFFFDTKFVSLSFKRNWLRNKIRPFLSVICILLAASLLLTRSRGALIAVIISLFFIGIIRREKIVSGILVFLLLLFIISPAGVKDKIFASIAAKDKVSKGIIARGQLWSEAAGLIKDSPFLGTGPNTYDTAGRRYKVGNGLGFYPHNSYLRMGAEVGLLGLVSFLLFIFMFFKISLRRLKESNDGFCSPLLLGLLSGVFAFLLHSFVDTNLYDLQLGNLMWFIMGFAFAVQNYLNKAATKSDKTSTVNPLYFTGTIQDEMLLMEHEY